MGKIIIIKGANYSTNAIGKIEIPEEGGGGEPKLLTSTPIGKGYLNPSDNKWTNNDYQNAYFVHVSKGKKYLIDCSGEKVNGLYVYMRGGVFDNTPSYGDIAKQTVINREDVNVQELLASVEFTSNSDGIFAYGVGQDFTQNAVKVYEL